MQSRSGSAAEAVVNVLVGYLVALAAQLVILPLFGVNLPLADNLLIGAMFTAVSLFRSYCLRRFFNRLHS